MMKLIYLILAGLVGITSQASALDLNTARADGKVCEKSDGLLTATCPEAADLVKSINAERLASYNQTAQDTGTDLASVQALAGQKLRDMNPGAACQ